MAATQSYNEPVINCGPQMIKLRAKNWIDHIRKDNPNKIILVSAIADATKVPTVGEYSHKYNVWVGGRYPNHCIDETHYDQENLITNEMATEIKVGLLGLQEAVDGFSPFETIAAQPQSSNEPCNEYNYDIKNTVSDLYNVHCISIAFGGLATETNFICKNLFTFIKGKSYTVAMTDCNHAAKNMRSQLVLGSSIVTGGDAAFDVGILRTGGEDPMTIAFMAMCLYFLHTFICAFNGDDIASEARITMLWSSLMWFSSLYGIHEKSLNNLSTACIGDVFLAKEKKVKIYVQPQRSL